MLNDLKLNDGETDHLAKKLNDGRIKLNIATLKQKRKHFGLSQEALALHSFELKIYLSVASIKRAESGKAVLYRTAKQFAKLYNLPIEALIGVEPSTADSELLVADCGKPVNQLTGLTDPELLVQDSRNVICLTLELTSTNWDKLQSVLQARFPLQILPDHLIQQGWRWHLVFGSQQASHYNISYGFRYAWALHSCLSTLDQNARLLLDSAQWYPASNTLKFHNLEQHTLDQLRSPVVAPTLWVAEGLQAEFQRYAVLEDEGSGYWRFVTLNESCRACPAFEQLDLSSNCYQCHERHDQLSLHGRERELLLMKMAMDEVLQDQLAIVLYIRGVAGVGKSRLIEEFVAIAAQHQLRCHHAWLSDSQHEFQQSLLAQLVFNALDIPLAQRRNDELLLGLLNSLHLTALQLTALILLMKLPLVTENPVYVALSASARDSLKIEAIASVLMQLSIKQPLLLVIEDVHWASQLDLDALGHLLTLTQDAPIIWLLSSRHEQDPLEQHLRQRIVDLSFTLLDLSPLRPADALQLASQFPDVDPAYRDRCISHSNGNPLFLTQLLRAKQMDSLPATLAHLIQAKLDFLTALDRQVLRYASVAGRQVSVQQILAVLGIEAYSFGTLIKHYLMRAQGDDYGFVHNLIAMSIYEAMETTQRNSLHLKWAHYYQGRDAASSAFHFHKAHDPRAITQYLLAIQSYYDRLEYSEARQLIEQCLSVDPTHFNADERYHLHHLAAITANKLGLTREARSYYEQAMQLAPNQKKKLSTAVGLIRTLNILEARDAEMVLLEQVLPQALAQQDTEILAQLFNIKANLSFFLGNINDCKTFHNQAIHYAEMTNLQEIRVRSYGGLGDASYAQGHMQTAREYLERSIVLAREHQLLEIETANLFMLATLRIYANETQAALEDAITAATLSKRVGNRRAEVVSRLTAGWILLSLCQYEQAEAQVSQGLLLARSMGAFRFEAFLLESLARLAWVNGQSQSAQAYITQAWQIIQQHQCYAFIGPWILATKVLLTHDDAIENQLAQHDLSTAQPILDKGCVGHNYYRFYVAVAEYYLMRNNPAQARHYAEQLTRYTVEQPCPWSKHFIQLIHGHADWLEAPQDSSRLSVWQTCFKTGIDLGLSGVTPCLLQRYEQQRLQ